MTYLTMTISLIINHNHPYICWKIVLINKFIPKSHRQRRQLFPNWTQKWHTWQYANVDNSRKAGMLGSKSTKISLNINHLNIPNKLKRTLSNELPSLAFTGANPGFGQGGGPGSEAESCQCSEVSNLQPGSRACLRALEAFGFLMLKYAFSHILETLFDIYFNTKSW